MVRSGRLARALRPRRCALRLRRPGRAAALPHSRLRTGGPARCSYATNACKLGPCRAWAAGWLHTDPRGQSGLRPRIENRRFLKENGRPDGIRTRIPRLERPGSSLLDDKAEKRERAAGIAV